MNLEAILEGLLFVVGDEGLTLEQISEILNIGNEDAKSLVSSLRERYESGERGIRITFLGNRFKLATKKEHQFFYQKLVERPDSNELSPAALECLAIVAYNEPITRIKLDEIRGVSSRDILKKLVAKGLLKEVGRSDQAGRPILYATTSQFCDYFGIAGKEDLPSFDIETPQIAESDLYNNDKNVDEIDIL